MSELSYDSTGAGDPTLLFLHGWCCDRSFFAPQYDFFSKTHRVVSVDLPGHGTSEVPEKYTFEAFAADVAELDHSLGVGRVVAIGHSSGALVALALARQTPQLVAAVVMVDPPPLRKEVWDGFAAQLIPSLEGPDGPAGRRRFFEQLFLPTDDQGRKARILETVTTVPMEIAIPTVQAISAFDATVALQETAVPVLTILSAAPMNDRASLLEASPTMTIGQTVGSGHFVQLEVPEQVNSMIERFLATVPVAAFATP
jgi:pimeloyl-ACP methyl ester carboxylesterase